MSLSKKSKVIIFILLAGIAVVFGVYKYLMQPPESIESKKVDITIRSEDFVAEIQKDFSVYEDKIVVLTGSISSIEGTSIILDNQIYCQFKDDVSEMTFEENQKITIKGHVLGYDDLLEEVKLDECIIQ